RGSSVVACAVLPLTDGCSYSNGSSRARCAGTLRDQEFPFEMEWTGFHEIQRPRALPDLQNSFERTDDVAGYAVNVLVERREWLPQALAGRSQLQRDVAAEDAPRALTAAGQEAGYEGAQCPLRTLDHELVPVGHDRPLTRRIPESPAQTRESRRATSSAECT